MNFWFPVGYLGVLKFFDELLGGGQKDLPVDATQNSTVLSGIEAVSSVIYVISINSQTEWVD